MTRLLDGHIIRFGLTGISGMLLDFGITWLLKEKLLVNKFIANSAGFSVAVINNYLLNRYWTFEQQGAVIPLQFLKFLLVSLAGLSINNLLLYGLTRSERLNFYLAKLLVILVVFCWNYTLNVLYTFH
ncbi:MAG: GtrA family protein [Ferruginibacter sp.]